MVGEEMERVEDNGVSVRISSNVGGWGGGERVCVWEGEEWAT